MGEGQATYLQRVEVYDLMAEGRNYDILLMGTKAIPGLVSILKNGEAWKKPIAIEILEKIDGPQSIRALRVAAEDADCGIRLLAMDAIAEKKGKVAEKAIKDMRKDPSGQIRAKAETLLLRRKLAAAPPKREKPMEKSVRKKVVNS